MLGDVSWEISPLPTAWKDPTNERKDRFCQALVATSKFDFPLPNSPQALGPESDLEGEARVSPWWNP